MTANLGRHHQAALQRHWQCNLYLGMHYIAQLRWAHALCGTLCSVMSQLGSSSVGGRL